MTTNHGGDPATDGAFEEIDALWERLEDNLAAYLSTMTDPGEGDHLRIELAGPDPEGHAGWVGNVADGAIEDRNWVMDRPVGRADEIASHVVWVLRRHFGIVHPQLLTYAAWGPAAGGVSVLGLCASDEIPVEGPLGPMPLVVEPSDRGELLTAVGRVLREKYEEEPCLDDDEDFVLHHLGQPVWVRVRGDQPAVEIMARVAHDVYSRRTAAVETGLLNRDNLWAHWTLRDRAIWQTLVLPGLPFVPSHLDAMLDVFLDAMAASRDDLAYRTGAKVA